ncbi:MAG: LrgB family protein [Cyanobacteria bacterium J06649_4]
MDSTSLAAIWVYLSTSPLLGLTVTLAVYSAAFRLYVFAKYNPLLNPVVVSVLSLIALLMATGTSYQDYFEGGQYIHFLLGPATVALAIPLHKQISKLKRLWLPVAIALISGITISTLSTVFIAHLFGASTQTELSLAPKSVTAPVAMGISEQVGGLPSLTAALVVTTGIIGATIGPKVFDWMRLSDDSTKGIAMGVTAHGIGTARAFQLSAEMGAFSGLAMALSAFASAILVPWILSLLGVLA